MRAPVATAFAIGFGLVVLIGYFVPANSGIPALESLLFMRTWMINWAVILAAFATLVAVLALVGTHWRKLTAPRNPDRYSFIALAGFLATVIYGLLAYLGFFGQRGVAGFQEVVNTIQFPIEASLMGTVAVVLTLAAFRLFQRRRGILPVVFVISTLVFLLVNSGVLAGFTGIPAVQGLVSTLQFLPAAGGRGILLGIALGSLMAGLRILLGAERPYSG